MTQGKRSTDYDPIAEHYDETRGGLDRGRRQARLLASLLNSAQDVLDIGCGTGVVGLGLVELGYRVTGVDLSGAMLRQALDRLDGRAVNGDAGSLPFAGGSFAQAYSVWVLHHVADIASVLREVARLLAPGGRYIVIPAGSDTFGEPDPALAIMEAMRRRLTRLERGWLGTADDLPPLAAAAGLRVAAVHELGPHSYEESPETLASGIANRAYSYLQGVDEDAWKREVEPAIAAIRALPDADRAVKHWTRAFPMVVLERP